MRLFSQLHEFMKKPSMTKKNEFAPMIRLNKDIFVSPVDRNNIGTYKCLTRKLLEVEYSDDFYKAQINSDPDFVRIAFFKDVAVGFCGAKILDNKKTLYIMTLGVLPTFQRLGIASEVLNFLLKNGKKRGCDNCELHVWENNPVGKQFYEKLGFVSTGFDPEYYTAITPRGAHILSKQLEVEE